MPEDKVCLPTELIVNTMSRVIDLELPDHKGEKKKLYISTPEAMEILNVSSPVTIQKYRDEGQIDFYQLSPKNIVYKREDIEKFILSKKQNKFT